MKRTHWSAGYKPDYDGAILGAQAEWEEAAKISCHAHLVALEKLLRRTEQGSVYHQIAQINLIRMAG